MSSRFSHLRPFGVALLAAALMAGLYAAYRLPARSLVGLDDLEQDLLEARFLMRGPIEPGDEVALLVADNETMARAPEVFERRVGWKKVIEAARAAGARVIVLDVFFSREEHLISPGLQRAIEEALTGEALSAPGRELLERVIAETQGDDLLAAALGARDDVILAFHFGSVGGSRARSEPIAKGAWGEVVAGPELPPSGERMILSLPRFYAQALGAGMATVYEDNATGRVLAVPLARRLGAAAFMPLSVAAVAAYDQVAPNTLAFSGATGSARIGEHRVRATEGDLLVNFRGPPGTFPTYSIHDLFDRGLPPGPDGKGALEDRIVIVGYTNLSQDTAATPFGLRMPGLEVHANAIDSLMAGDGLWRSARALDALYVLGLGVLLALFFLPGRLGPWWRALGLVVLLLVVVVAAQVAFVRFNLWLPLAGPLLVIVVPGTVALMASYVEEGLARQKMKRAFARYLSSDLLDELVRDPARASLQGERRRLTMLFTDIRSFTSWSERMEPLALAQFLNHFFTPMSAAVLENNGFLDKYIGDAVMAVFGAPVPRATHAADACRCALAMHKALLRLQIDARAKDIDLNMGVGINTGDVVVGNLGSEARFDYTVIGDPVNLASRIEGLTKRYGVFCLVGEGTRDEADDAFTFRAVDLVRVKGKQQPAPIFELCLSPYAAIDRWDAGLAAWRSGALTAARAHFVAFAAENPDDPLVALYLQRLDELNDTAPDGWDGVFTHETK